MLPELVEERKIACFAAGVASIAADHRDVVRSAALVGVLVVPGS